MIDEVDAVCSEWAASGQSPTAPSLQSLGMSVRAILERDGRAKSLAAWDGATRSEGQFPAALLAYLRRYRAAGLVGVNGFKGLVNLDSGGRGRVRLVSAHLCGAPEEPRVLVMGRWLDLDRLSRIASAGVEVLAREDAGDMGAERVAIRIGPQGEISSDTV